jgi:hypothetical protein
MNNLLSLSLTVLGIEHNFSVSQWLITYAILLCVTILLSIYLIHLIKKESKNSFKLMLVFGLFISLVGVCVSLTTILWFLYDL